MLMPSLRAENAKMLQEAVLRAKAFVLMEYFLWTIKAKYIRNLALFIDAKSPNVFHWKTQPASIPNWFFRNEFSWWHPGSAISSVKWQLENIVTFILNVLGPMNLFLQLSSFLMDIKCSRDAVWAAGTFFSYVHNFIHKQVWTLLFLLMVLGVPWPIV